jgi:hypothetical protein
MTHKFHLRVYYEDTDMAGTKTPIWPASSIMRTT